MHIFNHYFFYLNSLSIRREQISMEKKTQGMALLFLDYLIKTRFWGWGRNPKTFKFDIFPLVVIHSYVSQPLLVYHAFVITLFTCVLTTSVLTPSAGGCPTPAQLHCLLSVMSRWSLIAIGYFHCSSLCAHVKKMFKKPLINVGPTFTCLCV